MTNSIKLRFKAINLVFYSQKSCHCSDSPFTLSVPLSLSLSPPCHPSLHLSLSPSDMGRVGYPDKARLYKHSSMTGRTPSPERGISPQSSHTNAYIRTHTSRHPHVHTIQTHTSIQYYTGGDLYFSMCSNALIQP